MPSERRDVIRCCVWRGDTVESRHDVSAVLVDADGAVRFAAGDAGALVSLRSSAKPFQAAAALEAGALERLGPGIEPLALMCASHNGEPRHVAVVSRMLATLGLDVAALRCGAHPPVDAESAAALWRAGLEPDARHNNCSGKHAGMLAATLALGADPERYLEPEQPLQRAVVRLLEREAGCAPGQPAVDGCGVPAHFLPLAGAARLYARLAADATPSLARVRAAMRAHPELVAGRRRFDTDVSRATAGRVVSKVGAEGALGLAVTGDDGAWGLFVKVADGQVRATAPVALAVLDHHGLLDPGDRERLAGERAPVLTNHAGRAVGRIEVEPLAVG